MTWVKTKVSFIGVAVVLALVAMLATAGLASAAKPVPFVAGGAIIVTGISTPIPAGASGRVRITSEDLASFLPVASNAPALDGTFLSIRQKSNEVFSSPDLTTAVAIDGSSKGTFVVVSPGPDAIPGTVDDIVVATGQYHLNVSNSTVPLCQISGSGNWSTTGGGLKGRGTVATCLNFDPGFGTFVGFMTLAGSLN